MYLSFTTLFLYTSLIFCKDGDEGKTKLVLKQFKDDGEIAILEVEKCNEEALKSFKLMKSKDDKYTEVENLTEVFKKAIKDVGDDKKEIEVKFKEVDDKKAKYLFILELKKDKKINTSHFKYNESDKKYEIESEGGDGESGDSSKEEESFFSKYKWWLMGVCVIIISIAVYFILKNVYSV